MKQFRILAVALSLLVLLAMLVGCGGPKSIFPDKKLDTAIRDALGKPVGEKLTVAELANLTRLEAEGSGITDLSGLEYCTNLTELNLWGNQISDISPLVENSGLGEEAVEIALEDTRVQEILEGKIYETSVDYYVGVAKVIFTFGAFSIENFTADRLLVSVDLENAEVIDVLPMSLRFLRQGPQITESHLEQALEIALSDPYVQELLSGKEYKILGIQGLRGEHDWPTGRIGAHIYIKLDKNYSFKGDFPDHPSDVIKTYYLDATIIGLQISVNIEDELVGQIYPRIVRPWFLEPYVFIIGMILIGLLIGLGLYFAMRKARYKD